AMPSKLACRDVLSPGLPLGAHCAHGSAGLFTIGRPDFRGFDFFGRPVSLWSSELPVMALKHHKATVALPQAQYPAPGMLDHAGGLKHHLLHHRLDASALGNV